MRLTNKIIYSDNGVLTDISDELNEIHSKTSTLPVVAAEDYLYFGSMLPFNHRHIEVSTVNDQASVISVEIYTNQGWQSVAQSFDQTASSGVSLAQDGIIYWIPSRDYHWNQERSTEDITELSTLTIYDMYWARVSWSADLNAATALNYASQKFSTDDDLYIQYPELGLSNVLMAFETGKVDWDEQHITAAQQIVQTLKSKNYKRFITQDQILDFDQFKMASVHLTAAIIFRAFGDDYKDNLEQAMKVFNAEMEKFFSVDGNNNARVDLSEQFLDFKVERR